MLKICFVLASTLAHKILFAGSLSRYEHRYYRQVAEALAESTSGPHKNQVYLLEHKLDSDEAPDFAMRQVSEGLYTI